MDLYRHERADMAYERAGDGPVVLFLHNGGTSHTIWRNQAAALADRYCTVAVDLPGFGASPRPPEGIDLDGYVAVVSAFVDAELTAPLVIVGNCMGSNIATAVTAASAAGTVAGLVLVNPLTEATFSAGGLGLLHKMRRWAPGPTSIVRGIARKVVPPRVVAEMVLRMQLGPDGARRGLSHDADLLACNRRADQLPALVDVLDDMDAYAALDHKAAADLGVAVCTIYGARNRILSTATGLDLGHRLGAEREESFAACGHLPMLEQPDAVTSVLEAFLREHLPVADSVGTSATPEGSKR